jgi:signal transduction histidine kinase
MDATAIGALDPELVLARLRASRWALVRTILVARIGIAAAMLLVAARPSGGTHDSRWDVGVFVVYLAWALATGLRAGRVLDRIVRAPGWLWLEQAMCVGLVILGGGARVIGLYLCALPIVMATVFVSTRRGVELATADAVVVAVVLGGATLAGVTPGTEPVHTPEWPPGLVGLFIAVALFAYVRRLFSELERTGIAYQARSQETAAAITAAARAQTRTNALADVARRVDGVVPEIRDRVDRLRERRPLDSPWQDECDQLERLADHAQESLNELSTRATTGTSTIDVITDIVTAAIERARSLGLGEVDVAISDCDRVVGGAIAGEALARFIEEALWNAHKHGRPPITVTATAADGRVTIAVGDHGQGFEPGSASRRLGLRSLRRDAELLGGDVRITAQPGKPVTVLLTFPVGPNG